MGCLCIWIGKLIKCHLKENNCMKLANRQDIDYSEKKIWPQCFICPYTWTIFYNIQTCILVYIADLSWVFTGLLALSNICSFAVPNYDLHVCHIRINRIRILKLFWLKGLVCPHPEAIYLYVTKIFKDLLWNHLANQNQILHEAFLGSGNECDYK